MYCRGTATISPHKKVFQRSKGVHNGIVNTQIKRPIYKSDFLPVADIKLAGNTVISLLDSGASVCLLYEQAFRKFIPDSSIKQFNADAHIKSITGNDINVVGCVILPVAFGTKQFRHKFYIVKNPLSPYYQAIVGYDLLKSQKFSICFDTNTLKSNNTVLRFRDALDKNEVTTIANYARTQKKLILLAGESREVDLTLDTAIPTGELIQLKPCMRNPNLELTNTYCPVGNNRKITVTVTNICSENISINKNTKLGTIKNDFDSRDIELIKELRRKEFKESDFDLKHLDQDTRSKLLKLLLEFADIFSKRLFTIGRTHALQPNLQVDMQELPSNRPYRVPFALQEELRKQLAELEDANIIEKSNSHVSFPLLMIKKKNPSNDPKQQRWRLVVDYRNLNKHLKYPRYKLPIINHVLENLRGSAYFTTLDLSSSFWQIALKTEDRDMTTFSTPFGNFRYITLPQGLSASPETFTQLADQILAPISDLNIANFIDDFCISSQTVPQMLHKLRKLFERFREFGLTLNPEKCSFLLPEIKFLGHTLNAVGIRPVDENIRKITDFPTPNTVKKVRRFLGMAAYYRRHIKHFSEISASLTNLTRKNQKFKWSAEAQEAFDTLKERLSQPPILIHPDFNKEFILSCDSSDIALGAYLGQKDNSDIIRPIAYFSKKLNMAQRKYTIFEKELLSVVEAIKSFKYYLYGRYFIVRCDNAALTKLSRLESVSNRVARCFAFLSDYNFRFQHIKSSENNIADTFSRDFFENSTNKYNRSNSLNNNLKGTVTPASNKTKTNDLNINSKIHKPLLCSSEIDSEIKRLIPDGHENKKNIPSFDDEQICTTWIEKLPIGAGLINLGNTCYINVILQSLTHLPPLINYLLCDTYPINSCANKQCCMFCTLKNHIQSAISKTGEVIEPLEFYHNLESTVHSFQYFSQEDAHEYLCHVLDQLEGSKKNHIDCHIQFPNINPIEIINGMFQGIFRSKIKCLTCKQSSCAYDPFTNITLDISQGVTSLENALEKFMRAEYLQKSYHCFNCKSNVDSLKEISISKTPSVAIFHLKRSQFSQNRPTKLAKYVSYPENLNLSPYMTDKNRKPVRYKLNSVVVHSGNFADEGHYYCYVRDSNDKWYLMNDARVRRVNITEVLNQNAYILFYVKLGTVQSTIQISESQEFLTQNTQEINAFDVPLNNFPVNTIQIDLPTIENIKEAQRVDHKLSKIISVLESFTKHSSHVYKDYFLKDGLLMHSAFLPRIRKSTNVLQIVVPDKYKPHILAANHISHFGLLKTYNSIREKYFWENLYADTKNFIQSCKQCISFKSQKAIRPIPLQRNFVPSRPMQFVSCDHLGPFPRTFRGNRHILCFIDHFTKYIRLYAVPDVTSKVTAEQFLDFISLFGIPEKLLSDRGSSFTSDLFKNLCTRFGVSKLFTVSMHPQCNGLSEQINKNIKKSLSIFAQNTAQWDNYVNYYSLIYNSTLQSATNEKPAYLHLGYDPLLPTDVLNEARLVDYVSHTDFVERKAAELRYTCDKVMNNLELAAESQEIYQHKRARYRDFEINELVYLYAPEQDRHLPTTKRRNFFGPMRITKKHNKVNYSIINATRPGKEIKVHAERLIPFTIRKPHLDLFTSTIQDLECSQSKSNKSDTSSNKPYAVFDEPQLDDHLFPCGQQKTKIRDINNTGAGPQQEVITAPNPENDSPCSSPSTDSEDTIIYDATGGENDQQQNIQRSPYLLRDIQPRYLADRFFEWTLRMTE